MQNVIVNTSIYVYPYIYFRINLPDNNVNPQLNTYHIHMQACIHSRTKANSPRLHAHILRSCYITIQVNGIHTIARRIDDENKNPQVST